MLEIETQDETTESEPLAGKKLLIACVVMALLPVLFVCGVFSRGYESKTVSFAGFGTTSHGTCIGFKSMFLCKGQTFVADYEATVERGEFIVRLIDTFAPLGKMHAGAARLAADGRGQLRVPIDKSGFYEVAVDGMPGGNGYAFSYTMWWKAD